MTLPPVILNEVKNLEVSVAVNRSASLEILRYTQDDIESERLPRSLCSLAMTAYSINLAMTAYSISLAMTPHRIGHNPLFSGDFSRKIF